MVAVTLDTALATSPLAVTVQTGVTRAYAVRVRDGCATFYTRHTISARTWGRWTRTFGMPVAALMGDAWLTWPWPDDINFDLDPTPPPASAP